MATSKLAAGFLATALSVWLVLVTAVPALAVIPRITAGGYFTMVLKSDGNVSGYGDNRYGQLGDGTTTDTVTPVSPPISEVAAVASGLYHAVALTGDGAVWAWGWNQYGQLGDGTTTMRSTPGKVMDAGQPILGVVAVAAGGNHSVALKGDGTVWAWGENLYGQLGDGTTTDRTAPVQVMDHGQPLTAVVAVAAGGYHTVAVKADGTVWSWGYNRSGQLGNGTFTDSVTPVQVMVGSAPLTGVVAVAAGLGSGGDGWPISGGEFTVALKADGTVWAWGDNYYGQLGDHTTTDRASAVQVLRADNTGLTGVTAVAAGAYHSVASTSDQKVWAWGNNDCGQLGDGTSNESSFPVQMVVDATRVPLGGAVAVAAGSWHNVVLKEDGTVWGNGHNGSGQLGSVTYASSDSVQVQGLPAVKAIATWGYHTLALCEDGSVWGWGGNEWGQLGNGTTSNTPTPAPVINAKDSKPLTNVVGISTNSTHTLAYKSDGSVWAWGDNLYGQLGVGPGTLQSNKAVQVLDPNGAVSGVSAVSAGGTFSMALKLIGTSATVLTWGDNSTGQLGSGTFASRNKAGAVVGVPTNTTAIYAGGAHALARSSSGYAYAWGNNVWGQVGNGSYTNSPRPVLVTQTTLGSLTNVSAVAGGDGHSAALKSGGVWTWGDNSYGQLGNDITDWLNRAYQVPGLTGVAAVTATMNGILVRKNDNSYWYWGDGIPTPYIMPELSGATAAGVANSHTVALRDKKVWASGENGGGQLGFDPGYYPHQATAVVDVGYQLPASRSVAWQGNVGVKNDLPTRKAICTTVYPSSVVDDRRNIQTAIDTCAVNASEQTPQVVQLAGGTFNINAPIQVKSYVTLRGTGMGQTTIAGNPGDYSTGRYLIGMAGYSDHYSPVVAIAQGGATKGSLLVTTTADHGWRPNDIILINQQDTDMTNVQEIEEAGLRGDPVITKIGNNGRCLSCGWDPTNDQNRSSGQMVKVLAAPTARSVVIETPLYWNYTKLPQAVRFDWITHGASIEDLTIDNGLTADSTLDAPVNLAGTSHCWLKGVEVKTSFTYLLAGKAMYRNTIRDCKFHGVTHKDDVRADEPDYLEHGYDGSNYYGTTKYRPPDPRSQYPYHRGNGLNITNYASGNLIENNTMYDLSQPLLIGGSAGGNVISYNYITNLKRGYQNYYSVDPIDFHGAHTMMNLIEGNVVVGRLMGDFVWGSSSHNTFFRNKANLDQQVVTQGGWDVELQAYNRYYNFVGNVLGVETGSPIETYYQLPGTSNQMSVTDKSIFRLGYYSEGDFFVTELAGTPPTDPRPNDSFVATTILRHGNWDSVTPSPGVNEWQLGKSHVLPASFYRAAPPPGWGAITGLSWPCVGPELSPYKSPLTGNLQLGEKPWM